MVMAALEEAANSPDTILEEFRTRCLLTGKEISFVQRGQPCAGRCEGVNDEGHLVVAYSDGKRALHSGEVHLVRYGERSRD